MLSELIKHFVNTVSDNNSTSAIYGYKTRTIRLLLCFYLIYVARLLKNNIFKLDQNQSSRQFYNSGTRFIRSDDSDDRMYSHSVKYTRLVILSTKKPNNIRFQFQTFQSLKRSPRENNNDFNVIGDATTYSRTINVRAINIGVHNNNMSMRFDFVLRLLANFIMWCRSEPTGETLQNEIEIGFLLSI